MKNDPSRDDDMHYSGSLLSGLRRRMDMHAADAIHSIQHPLDQIVSLFSAIILTMNQHLVNDVIVCLDYEFFA
jgi:hypothetical protein